MTYRELAARIATFSEEEKDCDITVWLRISDEYIPVSAVAKTDCTDVLDANHPIMVVDN